MNFPDHFLWDAASSAFQCEGAVTEGGRTRSVSDVRLQKAHEEYGLADTSVAVDFYHHYKEDIALMKECGLNAFRMSVSWSRLIPNGTGEVSEEGVAFYNRVFDTCKANGIEPIVTLYHFDMPQVLIDRYQGFLSRRCIDDFVAYAKTCFDLFGNRVKYWLTINEQTVITAIPFFQGLKTQKESWQAYHHMCIANALVTKMYHARKDGGMIGPCISYTTRLPATCSSKDQLLAYEEDANHVFALCDTHIYGTYPKYFLNMLKEEGNLFEIQDGDMELLKDARPDFLGLNWYVTEVIGQYVDENQSFHEYNGPELPRQSRAVKGKYQYYQSPYTKYSAYHWNMDPTGLRFALRRMYDRYQIPLMVTENGWSANETVGEDGRIHDAERVEYISGMVEEMDHAIHDGVELIGYTPWSFTDVLSASQGMNKRYGLVFVDRTNDDLKEMKRIPKDSYYWYQSFLKKWKEKA